MKRTLIFLLIALFALGTVQNSEAAKGFEEQLKELVGKNAEGYIGPFATAFGTGMNSGLYHTGKVHGLLGFDVGIKLSVVTVSDEDTEFEFVFDNLYVAVPVGMVTDDTITINLNDVYPDKTAPTVFGSKDAVTLAPSGAEEALSKALDEGGMSEDDLNLFKGTSEWAAMLASMPPIIVAGTGFESIPLVVPQASVGLPFGTEVMLRYSPTIETDDFGDINFMGFGISHSLSQYIPIPLFPVAITAQYVSQKLEIGDLLESNHSSFGVRASMTVGLGFTLTPYVGLGFESSDLKVNYTFKDPNGELPDTDISLDLEGNNTTRFTAGVRFEMPFITINADYSLGEYSAIAVGLGLTLR